MYQVVYSPGAEKNLEQLDPSVAIRIVKKVAYYAKQKNLLRNAKRLKRSSLGDYRFRVGDYRVIFDVGKDGTVQVLMILKIGHRREVYDA